MEDSEWAKTFFPNSEPIFEALDKPQGLSTLRQFPVPTKSWCFGRRLSENNGSPIVVLSFGYTPRNVVEHSDMLLRRYTTFHSIIRSPTKR